IFTDGDLRRLLDRLDATTHLHDLKAQDMMTPNPKTVNVDALAAEAARIMEERMITQVLVVDDQNALAGVVNTNDLMRKKVI
ncbi:MAG: CBS domain-containing protein, partial [Saezia sp.]